VSTHQALPEMHPGIARSQTIFTAQSRWLDFLDLVRVVALLLEHLR
jgi:hypothetical protein